MEKLKITIVFLLILIFTFKKIQARKKGSHLLKRFSSNLKSRNHIRRRLNETISNHLMKDPEINIETEQVINEAELREKANIHRSRLSKYGRSKLNGVMFYLGERGGVYQITKTGNKKYV